MTEPARQRRGRAIAMTGPEIDEFLTTERTCRVATAGRDGRPHVAPLWFAWDGTSLWLNSVVRSQRWTDTQRDPRVAVVVDAGVEYTELRGVELSGAVVAVGDRDWDAFGDLVTDDVVIDYRNHDVAPPAGNGPYRGRDQVLAALGGELMRTPDGWRIATLSTVAYPRPPAR